MGIWESSKLERRADLQLVYISGHMIQMVMQGVNAKRDNRSKDMFWSSAIFGGQEEKKKWYFKRNECTQKSADNQGFFWTEKLVLKMFQQTEASIVFRSPGLCCQKK